MVWLHFQFLFSVFRTGCWVIKKKMPPRQNVNSCAISTSTMFKSPESAEQAGRLHHLLDKLFKLHIQFASHNGWERAMEELRC